MKSIEFGESLEWLNEWIRSQQETLNEQMDIILKMKGPSDLAVNLLIIALIPAVGEEWLFRGVIQKLLKDKLGNVHLSIWITGALFALFHMSFLYFIALCVMGVLLGYLKEWSGSLWLPMAGHFANNAIILFVTYFYPEWISDSDSMELDPVWLSVSVVLSTLLIWTIYKLVSGNKNFKNPIQIQKDEWDIDP